MSRVYPASKKSKRTYNPIRNIVDNLNPPKNHPKPLLNLALGDPTVYNNLFCPQILSDTIKELVDDHSANGYIPSVGLSSARRAIASYNSTSEYTVHEEDVVIASGCSGAIDLVLTAIIDEGDNVLVPKPCFPLYQVITESLGGKVKHYPLKAEDCWECDVEAMDALVDSNTKAIIINNPSNPCGSNYSKEHLIKIAAVARKHNLLIIADEIYGRCVFSGDFYPMHLCSGDVPVISVGGLAKEFIVPGWRVGWLILHDQGTGLLADIRSGIRSLTQIVLGANSLIQAAIPKLLTPTAANQVQLQAFMTDYMDILRKNADLCVEETSQSSARRLSALPSYTNLASLSKDSITAAADEDDRILITVTPSAAMYVMIEIKIEKLTADISDDAIFARRLLEEENVFVLPGKCFSMDNYFRLVICPPKEVLQEAFQRMHAFCERHRRLGNGSGNATSTTTDSIEPATKKMKV